MQFQKKRCVAMLLAGGQGSRLMVLTENTAKPAVPFGGKYRIIDFPLSNCVNSKIDTVGILTQYQPLELNEYIGNGQPWGLNSSHGGVQVLPPYAKSKNSEWYKGTANAIYQNIPFIERYNPDNVLILSGDHIYKMDYAAMLRFHEQRDSDCTIAVREGTTDAEVYSRLLPGALYRIVYLDEDLRAARCAWETELLGGVYKKARPLGRAFLARRLFYKTIICI